VARRKPVSRRGFIRAAISETTKRVEELAERAEGRYVAPGTLLPRSHPGDPVPFAPLLDPTKCSGCDACARLCPHGAISIEKDGGLPAAYVVHPDSCTGCGICTDVCERHAVTIAPWRPVQDLSFPLVNRRCRSCGVTFHLPKTEERARSAGSLCPICSRADHHRDLFQVLR
jgi:ferredoxin